MLTHHQQFSIRTDRSRIETFLECPEKRRIQYVLNREAGVSVDMELGSQLHETLADLLVDETTPKPIWTDLPSSYETTAMGLISAARQTIRTIRNDYDVISVEHEEQPIKLGVTPIDEIPIELMTRFDIVVRRKGDGLAFVVNWKTTTDIKRFHYFAESGLQAMLEPIALEKLLNEPVGLLLIGLDKGRKEKTDNGPQLINPFTRIYTNGSEKQLRPNRKKGWEKQIITPEMFPDHLKWLEQNEPDTLRECISHPLPIIPPRWKKTQVIQEIIQIETMVDQGIANWHNWKSCRTRMGECPFFDCCHLGLDPMDMFPERTPNHPTEIQTLKPNNQPTDD
jgi:hypothetical protein